MKVLIATNQSPFVFGGAEAHALSLKQAVEAAGHKAEILSLPFSYRSEDLQRRVVGFWNALSVDDLDISDVDRVICIKFPGYYLQHSRKSVWLTHQHRVFYDLAGTAHDPCGGDPAFREDVRRLDTQHLGESQRLFTISKNVSARLLQHNGLKSDVLYHPPPGAESFTEGGIFPFIFAPGRLEGLKRHEILIHAMAKAPAGLRAIVSGEGGLSAHLQSLAQDLGVADRVAFVGHITDEHKRRLYANCLGVYFGPFDEDYGYVTLEAMLSAKPVITFRDSGGPCEFVHHGETGFVLEPDSEAVCGALHQLWEDQAKARAMGRNGKAHYQDLDLRWDRIVDALV